MANEDQVYTHNTSPFDAIRHRDEWAGEYWSARELYKILGYTEWRNFRSTVLKRAMKACEENGRAVSEHFVQSYKVITCFLQMIYLKNRHNRSGLFVRCTVRKS